MLSKWKIKKNKLTNFSVFYFLLKLRTKRKGVGNELMSLGTYPRELSFPKFLT
jgi:hypothetical protein